MRDYALGTTFDIKFTTRNFSTGAPFTLAGSPVISAYPDNSATELTAGITLSVDFDSRTGLNNVRIVATSGNGYASGSNYALVITTGTVNSVSVVGEVIGEFSLEAQSPLRPTTAGLTLDVSATGEAGVDWANVGGKTTSNALTNTTIATTQKVDIETIKTNPVVNGGTVTFASNTTVANTTGAVGSVTGAVGSVTGNVGGSVASLTTNNDKTGYALTSGERNSIADAMLDRDMSTGTDSGSTTVRTMRQALRFLRNKWAIVVSTLTVYKEDDSTTSWTASVTTDATALPITQNDPAGP